MARIFISHANVDVELARAVRTLLADDHHDIFLDIDPSDGITPGEDWEEYLYRQLEAADAVLCIVTKHYVASKWCHTEVAMAKARGVRVIPIRTAGSNVSHPLLTPFQYWTLDEDDPASAARLLAALRRLNPGPGSWSRDRLPYPGLSAFDGSMRAVYFGRQRETADLARSVRALGDRPAAGPLLVVGPSGCGKSSLALAGLAPVMADDPAWHVIEPFRPGSAPVESLLSALTASARGLGLRWTTADVRRAVAGPGSLHDAMDEILSAAGPPCRRLLLIVDQLEEVFTLTEESSREEFFRIVRTAAQGPVRIVGTVRSEYLPRFMSRERDEGWGRRSFPVTFLGLEHLPEIIESPAHLAGLRVESTFAARLAADMPTPDSLPLLAFALERVAAATAPGGELTYALYAELGGVQSAIGRQAGSAYAESLEIASGDGTRRPASDRVIRLLLRLVDVGPSGTLTRRWLDLTDLDDTERRCLQPFVEHRLLQIGPQSGRDQIGVAHEAFLRSWKPLSEAIEQQWGILTARSRLERAATDWEENGRSRAYLLGYNRTAVILATLTPCPTGPPRTWRTPRRYLPSSAVAVLSAAKNGDRPGEVRGPSREFLRHSARRAAARRISILTVALLTSAVLAVVTSVAVLAHHAAGDRQRASVAARLTNQAETVETTDPFLAQRLALAGARLHPGAATTAALVDVLSTTRVARLVHRGGTQISALATPADPAARPLLAFGGVSGAFLVDLANQRSNVRALPGPREVTALALTPDGRTLAVGANGHGQSVTLWDVSTPLAPRPLGRPLEATGDVRSLAFAAHGRILAEGGSGMSAGPMFWDVGDPASPRALHAPGRGAGSFYALTVSADGRLIAAATSAFERSSGTERTEVHVWSVPAGTDRLVDRYTLTTPTTDSAGPTVLSVAFTPSGRQLAASDVKGGLRRWRLDGDRPVPLRPIDLGAGWAPVAFSPDGRTMVTSAGSDSLRLWDLTDLEHPSQVSGALQGHTLPIRAVSFTPNGSTLVTTGDDGKVVEWDLLERASTPRMIGHASARPGDGFTCLAADRDGTLLAAGAADGGFTIWHLRDPSSPQALPTNPGQPVSSGQLSAVHAIAVSPSGDLVAVGRADNTISLWRARPGEPVRQVTGPLPGFTSPVTALGFSADGRLLAGGGGDRTVRVWDVSVAARPRPLGSLAEQVPVTSLAWAPHQSLLAVGAGDGQIHRWSVPLSGPPRLLPGPLRSQDARLNAVAFSVDGNAIAAGSDDGGVWLWNVSGPRQSRLGRRLSGPSSPVNSVVFSPDGATVAAGSDDFNATLWNLTDRAAPALLGRPLSGPLRPVGSLAYSGDGRLLYGVGDDRTLMIWDVEALNRLRRDPISSACARTGGGMTQEEWKDLVPDARYRPSCR
ncbi:conserved hypothetical protein [Frankia canadensis]|uniref:TIR domain-containing protein n=1 Tax=Frankia canadensis TaxID=1836972 RepID=A0A2I2KJS5_9ACTN|nr:TIR domain-containing protein [Frankia canadensis]SNQ45910.1 conserved hypothetical protein [Frankia canadensis]SOU53200.1 conserved hypothetical protein [Frankia canadensis]